MPPALIAATPSGRGARPVPLRGRGRVPGAARGGRLRGGGGGDRGADPPCRRDGGAPVRPTRLEREDSRAATGAGRGSRAPHQGGPRAHGRALPHERRGLGAAGSGEARLRREAVTAAVPAEALRHALAGGSYDDFAELYAEQASLDASVPGGRHRIRRPAAIVAALARWWSGSADLAEWTVRVHPDGFELWAERIGSAGA